MRALENDLIAFFQLVDLVSKYADTINDEARRRQLFNLCNRVNKVTGACQSFCTHFKTNLSREQANILDDLLEEGHASDALTLLLQFMTLTPKERDNVREIMSTIKNNNSVVVTI